MAGTACTGHPTLAHGALAGGGFLRVFCGRRTLAAFLTGCVCVGLAPAAATLPPLLAGDGGGGEVRT